MCLSRVMPADICWFTRADLNSLFVPEETVKVYKWGLQKLSTRRSVCTSLVRNPLQKRVLAQLTDEILCSSRWNENKSCFRIANKLCTFLHLFQGNFTITRWNNLRR